MTHALGLKDVAHAGVVEPGLMAMPETVQGQAGLERQPGSDRYGIGWRLLGAQARAIRLLVVDEASV